MTIDDVEAQIAEAFKPPAKKRLTLSGALLSNFDGDTDGASVTVTVNEQRDMPPLPENAPYEGE